MRQRGVLALDIATNTGWAWHTPGEPGPLFGVWPMPGKADAVGQRCKRLEDKIFETLIAAQAVGGISHIVVEAQHVGSFGKGPKRRMVSPQTVAMLYALSGIAEKVAFETGIIIYKLDISTWRKHFLGRGAGFGDRNPKKMALERAAQYGWYTDSEDAADALGILDCALSLLPNYDRPWRDNVILTGN